MKKTVSLLISVLLIFSAFCAFPAGAEELDKGKPDAFATSPALYAHAVVNSGDSNAWTAWQSAHDESFNVINDSVKYFFLPTSAADDKADIYNAYQSDVTVNGVKIAPGETATVSYSAGRAYTVNVQGSSYTLNFMKSNAEAAVYINNSDADGNGTDLMSYLNQDKSLSAKATGAIVDPSGKIDNTDIKKIKGRGNTTWDKPKKGYNVTYNSKVSIGGMAKSKKYSLLANYQDDSLSRNRILYDLSDAVGMPYASDSRYIDFYVNGFYWGSYQMCEKVEAGDLVYDVDEEDYLNEDGTVKSDFSFIAEVDASASADDYYFVASNGTKITLKAPELDREDPNYDAVLAYAKEKYDQFARTARSKTGKISNYGDVESLAKLYLINELGKNWDSGVSSTFFTYKPDSDGNYKFYGSPVWDYDNSLGNAVGVSRDLRNMGVDDYTDYTGWWCQFKGKNASDRSSSDNIINQISVNQEIIAAVPSIWFEDFVPAINHFAGSAKNQLLADEIYSSKQYFDSVYATAEMNYTSGWLLNTGSWIANHNSLYKASYDYDTKTYSVSKSVTRYQNSSKGMFDYAADWMTSRAAWISNELMESYGGYYLLGDITRDGQISVSDAYQVQLYCAQFREYTPAEFELGDVNFDGVGTVSDATLIQRYAAEMIDDFRNLPEPEPDDSEPVTNPEDSPKSYDITFTNTLDWDGNIYCYYYGDGFNPVTWPGEVMTSSGTNSSGKTVYSFTVPEQTGYVIFTNGNVQTEKIPFDGTKRSFYAVNAINEKGRYEFAAD